MYDFNKPIERRHTHSAKWDGEWMQKDPDMLPLWVADMDFEVLPQIKEAVARVVEHGVFGYSNVPEGYYDAVVGWMDRRHGWRIEKEWIMPAPGIVPAINAAINCFTAPKDEILIFSPVYYPFLKGIEGNGRTPVQFRMDYKDGQYSIDFDALRKTLESHNIKALILCSPHNPVGRIWRQDELEQLAALAKEFHLLVLDDEIHMDLEHAPHKHIPLLKAAPDLADQTLVFTAPSKTFNIAGLQVSSVIIPDADKKAAFKAHASSHGLVTPGLIGLSACQAAYEHGDVWLDELLAHLKSNTDYVRDFLKDNLPEVKLVEPEGLYLLWLDFNGLGLSPAELEDLMLHKAHVWLDEGYIFGPGGEGFERINVAAPRATIEECMKRIAKAVHAMQQEKAPAEAA